MNRLAAVLATYCFSALWQLPLLAATGWLVCRMLRRLGPSAAHRVWVAVLALSVVLPASSFLRAPALGPGAPGAGGTAWAHLLPASEVLAGAPGILRLASGWLALLAVGYGASTAFFLVRFAVSVAAAARMVRRARPLVPAASAEASWQALRLALRAPEARFVTSTKIASPVTLWLGRDVLVLPAGFVESTTAEDLRVALAHEGAHIRRHDFGKNLLYEALGVAVAFHPVSWWVKAQLAQTREMVCDALAVEVLGEPRIYVQSLLRLAGAVARAPHAANFNAIGIFDANILEERVMTLRAKQGTVSAVRRYGLVCVGGVCLLLAATGGARAAVGLSAQERQMYKVGDGVSAPKLLSSAEPVYPEAARRQKGAFEGSCLIGLVVDAAGMPAKVHVERSLAKEFDESAVKAVEQYRFAPAMRAGEAVPVVMKVEVRFAKY